MRQGGYNFGGEPSGHMIFLDHTTTGDGLVTALQLLAVIREKERPLSELAAAAITKVPQVLVNRSLPERRALSDMPRTQDAIRAAEADLGDEGRVLVRWSGTEAKLRVMVEGPEASRIETLAQQISAEAQQDIAST
ncbi:MAG: phosphoglucosamine mutase, partial [Polyangiales bacterium]